MKRILFSIISVIVLVCFTALAGQLATNSPASTNNDKASPDENTADAEADFKWFSTLEIPDVRDHPFVRLVVRGTNGIGQSSQNLPAGFLLNNNGDFFTILTLSLAEYTYTNTWNKQIGLQVGTTNLDLRSQVVEWKLTHTAGKTRHVGGVLSDQATVFVMAWECWRKGYEADAQQFYKEAKQMGKQQSSPDGEVEAFRLRLEKDLGYALMVYAMKSFATWGSWGMLGIHPSSRPELLSQFERIENHFGHSEYHEKAVEIAARLRKMIQEDEQHTTILAKDLGSLPVNDRVQELIFQLRNQDGAQLDVPGRCNIFLDECYGTNTPAHQLVRIGYPAVPQLIAALDDRNLTRAVTANYCYGALISVLTVGDCSERVLNRITGRSFETTDISTEYTAQKAKKDAEKWWIDFQQKGKAR